jgi:hypothetical protein
MEAIVSQTFVGQPLESWRVRWSAESARLTEADIVEQD